MGACWLDVGYRRGDMKLKQVEALENLLAFITTQAELAATRLDEAELASLADEWRELAGRAATLGVNAQPALEALKVTARAKQEDQMIQEAANRAAREALLAQAAANKKAHKALVAATKRESAQSSVGYTPMTDDDSDWEPES